MDLFYSSGIVCYDKLDEMLKLVNSTVVKKESKFVVQKYIGQFSSISVRIIQTGCRIQSLWFFREAIASLSNQVWHTPVVLGDRLEPSDSLVLQGLLPTFLLSAVHFGGLWWVSLYTKWWFNDSLIFMNFHSFLLLQCRSIHLSNVAIQKHFENEAGRNSSLPADNIWSNEDFEEYLR